MMRNRSLRGVWTGAAVSVLLLAGAVPAAGAGVAADGGAVLQIRTADLPARVAAAIQITGPSGFRRTLTGPATLGRLAAGRYTVTAGPVRDAHGTTYVASAGTGPLTLAAGTRATRTVDYYTRIPATTRPVPAGAGPEVTPAAGGQVLVSVHGSARYAVGQVLAAGVGAQTPDGLLVRVVAVQLVPGGERVTAVPATLRDAFPQGQLSFASAFPSQSPSASPAGATSASAGAAQAGKPAWTKKLKCGNSAEADLDGTLDAALSTDLQAHWTPAGITAQASATVHESSSLTASLSGAATCTLAPVQVGSTRTLGAFDVQIGPIPVVVVPRLSFFVRGAVNTKASVTASVGQDFTATAGLAYAGGTVTPIASATATNSYQPPAVQGTGRVTLAVSTRLTTDLYGAAGPTVNIDPGLDLSADVSANPWWTLDGTLDAGATLRIKALGINAARPAVLHRRYPLAHADGPFPPSAVTDIPTNGNGTDGPVLGPDGRLWLVVWDATSNGWIVEAVNPTTHAVQDYHQVPTATVGKLGFTGPLAFDGAGNLWLTAQSASGTLTGPVLVRFTPSAGLYTTYPVPSGCLWPQPTLYSAADGAVWASCPGYSSNTVLTRITSGGAFASFPAPTGAPVVGALVPGANGTMWATARGDSHTSVVEFGTDGQAQVFHDDGYNTGGLWLAGNGTGAIVEAASCNDGPGGASRPCFQRVGADGTRTLLGHLPAPDAAAGQVSAPLLDQQGDCYVLVEPTSGAVVPSGQYYWYEMPKTGTDSVHPFSMPATDQSQGLQVAGDDIPVMTSDRTIWLQQDQYPLAKQLLGVTLGSG